MPGRWISTAAIVAAFWLLAIGSRQSSRADEPPPVDRITLHENLTVGRKINTESITHLHSTTVRLADGQTETIDRDFTQYLTVSAMVLAQKDGSATAMRVTVDPVSHNLEKLDSKPQTDTPCTAAGKTFTIRRRADGSVVADYNADMGVEDSENILGLLEPDENIFPDSPVAVGDTWDVSVKMASHERLGKHDQLHAHCRLDWVKMIDGRKMAHITCSLSRLLHDDDGGDTQIDLVSSAWVDVGADQIIQIDQNGTVKSSSPSGKPLQITVTADISGQGKVLPNPSPNTSTQP